MNFISYKIFVIFKKKSFWLFGFSLLTWITSAQLLEIDYSLEKNFKPGLYNQTKAFLNSEFSEFCSLKEQYHLIKNIYNKISGY